MTQRLAQKSAIVTGAGSGIGRAIAQVFASEGAKVLVTDVNEEAARQTVQLIRETGGEAHAFKVDVTNRGEVEAMAREAVERYGRIDVLSANAGIYPSASIDEMTEEDWDKTHDINLKGVFFTVKAVWSKMKEQRYGRIVLTSSITGPLTGYPGWAHYGATKAGVLGFMRSAAIEFARHNVTINAVLPGNIMTGSLDSIGEDYLRRMEQAIPIGRLGEPDDIARAMLFLASDEAKYITGQTLVVDGGQTLPESVSAA
ncbi:MAG TPA: 3-oxoacyl-ACP reductase FabG [Pyrinomonadaceae bacterium]|nr:3-oxoacyl-ACP reductase FabG [Pyrinomonadaceae bacterium]